VTIHDEPTGTGIFVEFNGTANDYTGDVRITGFANDLLNGRVDFDGLNGGLTGTSLSNPFNMFQNITSDGKGGDLAHLAGGGSLDFVGTTRLWLNTFVLSKPDYQRIPVGPNALRGCRGPRPFR
jgi:hypothetical protein